MLSSSSTPKWLKFLERRLSWLAIPHIAVLIVTLQALGFLMVQSDPIWVSRLALIPELVLVGQYWRLITFLALPLSDSFFWVIFTLWFIYSITNTIENEWGTFKTTLYVLISVLVTIAFSFTFNYPISSISHFESTLFLAAAALFPEMEIRLYMAIPIKIKWLAWLALAMTGLEFVRSEWLERLLILATYSNYLIFFGPSLINNLKLAYRRADYRRKSRR